MIVAVSAAPVYDKGELVSRLASTHGIDIVRDPAPRLCERYGFQTLYEMPPDLQRACRVQLLSEHLEDLQQRNDVVFEYSVAEWIADWMRWFWPTTATQEWERLMEVASTAAKRYDMIYHLDTGTPRSYDGYVWLDRANARQIDSLVRFAYREFGVWELVRSS
jgi:hypothetical protein